MLLFFYFEYLLFLTILKKAYTKTKPINKNKFSFIGKPGGGDGGNGKGGVEKTKPLVNKRINTDKFFFIAFKNCVKINKNIS